MRYDWILFDADGTLFTFDAFAGLRKVFASFAVSFTKQDYNDFEKINQPLWVQYQNGEIDLDTLKKVRFSEWGTRLDIEPLELNNRYSMAMAEICQPFEGVHQTLRLLSCQAKLGIITNGSADMQQTRLEHTGLAKYFEFIVVSETVGVAKPNKVIFERAFSLMGSINKERVLMVGDNPISDIQGGINAGIDTCWLQSGEKNYPINIKPTFIVYDWYELAQVLLPTEKPLLATMN